MAGESDVGKKGPHIMGVGGDCRLVLPLIAGGEGCSSVVSGNIVVTALEFKAEDPGFDPQAGQCGTTVFLSLRVNSCADLFVPDPPPFFKICVWHTPKFVRTLKIPYPSVVKE